MTAAAAFYFIKKHAWLWLRIAGILCIALPAFLGLMVAVNWDYVFVTFHQLVFNNDYWLFDPSTDPIIDILPDGYFMHCAIMIFALVFVGSFLCFIFSFIKTTFRLNFRKYIWYNKSTKKEGIYYLEGIGETYE